MEKEWLILVDTEDREIGTMSKEDAHRLGKLHRAFSVFLYDGDKMLIQKRADGKYHSGGLWTNACCSHPRVGQTLEEAVHSRMKLEIGLDAPVDELFSFTYRTRFAHGLYEYEYDHVFLGYYPQDGSISLDPEEASDWRWISLSELRRDLVEHPGRYTSWFLIAAPKVIREIERRTY